MFLSRMMVFWLFLLLLFSWSSQDGQEAGVSRCGPQNLSVSGSSRTLQVTWEDDPSCSALSDELIYQLTVIIEDKMVYHNEVPVTPERIGSNHSWNWTSSVPLACASHSVRLTSLFNNRTEEVTLPGFKGSKYKEIFPQDQLFEVGSLATFCCNIPDGEEFKDMYLVKHKRNNSSITHISHQRYALTVRLEEASDRCNEVKCKTNREYGACAYIGYRPDDRDLQCETRDLKSIECSWNEGRNTKIHLKSPTVYHLNGRTCPQKRRCSHEIKVDDGEKNWTLTAENKLGRVELHDAADLMKRVHMFAPGGVKPSHVGTRNVSLLWNWTVPRYNSLNLTCEVQLNHGGSNTTSPHRGPGLNTVLLTDLIPNWEYRVKVRCGTAQHFWRWSDWSHDVSFRTEDDVPDAPDVWMQMKENHVEIIWKKLLTNQSHGNVSGYSVTFSDMSETVRPSQHSFIRSLDMREQQVTLRAQNQRGNSPASTIIIPSISSASDKSRVTTSRIHGHDGGFSLSWSHSPAVSCGYIVDWRPTVQDGPVDWLKLPTNQTNVRITSESFRDGLRYTLSIYACTPGAPVLLETREGYIKETRMENNLFKRLKSKQLGSDVEVSWDPVPLTEQSAFIHGYVLSYNENNNVTTNDPQTTILTAKNLKMGSYTFTVSALTAVGECGHTEIQITVNSTDDLVQLIFIAMGTGFVFLCITTVLCYRHWTHIKMKVYPPIPRPVVSSRWLTSPVKNSKYVHTEQNLLGEEVMDVPQLHSKCGAPDNSYIKEDTTNIVSLSPNDYYIKSLHDTPTSLSGLQTSPFRAVVSNPSYNLMMETPGPRDSTPEHLNKLCEYKPQNSKETFPLYQNPEDPENMSCNLTYILVPQPFSSI